MTLINVPSLVSSPPVRSSWADWAGMLASIGCAIHCAAMPLVLAYLPALGLDWLAGEGFHRWMAVICFVLAAAAFVPGLRRHGSFIPAMWGAAGLTLLTAAAFGMEGECCTSCAFEGGVDTAPTAACQSCALCEASATADGGVTAVGAAKTSSVSESSMTGVSYASFVTPLGGLLLVVGHVVNHVMSCRCQASGCCLKEEPDAS